MDSGKVDPPNEIRLQAARIVLGFSKSWEFPSLANRALQQGIYSPALAELAEIDEPVMSQVEPLFRRAIDELGEKFPSQADAAWILTRHCVEQVLDQEKRPANLLRFLWWELLPAVRDILPGGKCVGDELDIAQLMGIYDSYSEPQENYDEATGRTITDENERQALLDRHARIEASHWLKRHANLLTPR